MTHLSRRKALAVVVVAPAMASLPAIGVEAEDAELRQLWAEYLAQLEAYNQAEDIYRERRSLLDAEFESKLGPNPFLDPNAHTTFSTLWKKHGLRPFSDTWNREGRKLSRIVRSVKLSVLSDLDDVTGLELAEAIEDARAAIGALIGVDYIAATGRIEL
jgi:hypothetical protein